MPSRVRRGSTPSWSPASSPSWPRSSPGEARGRHQHQEAVRVRAGQRRRAGAPAAPARPAVLVPRAALAGPGRAVLRVHDAQPRRRHLGGLRRLDGGRPADLLRLRRPEVEAGMRVAIHQGPFDEVPRTVAETGADLVVTAEMSTTGYHIGARTHELAEPADGPTAARLSALAKETGVAVAYGYPETDGEHVYNSYREPF